MRKRVANDLSACPQSQFRPIREASQIERARQHPDDVRVRSQHLLKRLANDPPVALQLENPERFTVYRRNTAITRDDQNAVPHAEDDLSKKPIGNRRSSGWGRFLSDGRPLLYAVTFGLGHSHLGRAPLRGGGTPARLPR
jgi:hypothetical protein